MGLAKNAADLLCAELFAELCFAPPLKPFHLVVVKSVRSKLEQTRADPN